MRRGGPGTPASFPVILRARRGGLPRKNLKRCPVHLRHLRSFACGASQRRPQDDAASAGPGGGPFPRSRSGDRSHDHRPLPCGSRRPTARHPPGRGKAAFTGRASTTDRAAPDRLIPLASSTSSRHGGIPPLRMGVIPWASSKGCLHGIPPLQDRSVLARRDPEPEALWRLPQDDSFAFFRGLLRRSPDGAYPVADLEGLLTRGNPADERPRGLDHTGILSKVPLEGALRMTGLFCGQGAAPW